MQVQNKSASQQLTRDVKDKFDKSLYIKSVSQVWCRDFASQSMHVILQKESILSVWNMEAGWDVCLPGVPKLMPPAPTNPSLRAFCGVPEEKHLCTKHINYSRYSTMSFTRYAQCASWQHEICRAYFKLQMLSSLPHDMVFFQVDCMILNLRSKIFQARSSISIFCLCLQDEVSAKTRLETWEQSGHFQNSLIAKYSMQINDQDERWNSDPFTMECCLLTTQHTLSATSYRQ